LLVDRIIKLIFLVIDSDSSVSEGWKDYSVKWFWNTIFMFFIAYSDKVPFA